jgi:DEP domain-containing protein 5
MRPRSTSSVDRSSVDSAASPRSTSTHSTIKEEQRQSRERWCNVNVIDGYMKEEAFLNFDLLGSHVKPDTLVAITALKGDAARGVSSYGSVHQRLLEPADGGKRPPISILDQDLISSRYVFFAKDMPRDMKSRNPDTEVCVAKHIADAFGMKKGLGVLLATV